MATEIERKYLVIDNAWRAEAGEGVAMRQGYVATGPPTAIRVRIADNRAILNLKKATLDISRTEFEYPVPLAEGEAILNELCEGHLIEKVRYTVAFDGLLWEIDVFSGANQGLVVAEVELADAAQAVTLPPWVGEEVSHDARYLNSSLSRCPYCEWA